VLKITVPGVEHFDDERQEFITIGDYELELEHSLVSLSKWESTWCKPFLGSANKTPEQTIDYIKCMLLITDVPPDVFGRLSKSNLEDINEYLTSTMTATWFSDAAGKGSREIITSEIIYYWMISLNIPFECQYWHLNRLFALIKVCNQKNTPPKKMSRSEMAARNRELNERRKAQLGTSG
jgi:hypothetical protein